MPVLRDFRPPAGGEILNLTCTLAKGAFTPNFSTMSDVASVIPGLLCLGFIGWIVSKIWNSMTSAEPVTVPQTLPDVRPKPPFDLYRDARGPTPLFGFPVEFSSKYEASLYPNIVTGLTLNRDYLAVRRGSYGVKAFLLDQNLTVGITAGVPPGFKEAAQYTMELESETEVARFPISFQGWLQIIDAARRCGAQLEIAEDDLPASLRVLIETPLPGDEAIKPARAKSNRSPAAATRETGRCKCCGANVGRKTACDFCGASQ